VKKQPSTHEILRLAFQFTYLAGGPVIGASPFDIAMHKVRELGILDSAEGVSKGVFKKQFYVLREWMTENHPDCPTRKKKTAKASKPTPEQTEKAIQPKKIKAEKAAKPPKKTTLGAVISYIKRAEVDPQSDAFLSSFAWRATRMMALKQHGAICQCCGASAKTGAVIHVDHIKPRQERPDLALDVDNLQVLCHECNGGKGNWDQTDWRFLPAGRAVELLH
jgi:hypothetical protein